MMINLAWNKFTVPSMVEYFLIESYWLQKSLSLYAATTGKSIIPNEPVTSVSLVEGQTVTDACANTDKMEVEGDNEEKSSFEVCLEKYANSDKKQNGAVRSTEWWFLTERRDCKLP